MSRKKLSNIGSRIAALSKTKRLCLMLVILAVVLILLMPIKWACYELNPQMDVIRQSVGKEVVFTITEDFFLRPRGLSQPIEAKGILTEAHYEQDDEWGFFFLRIGFESSATPDYPKGHWNLKTFLGPSELWRIQPVKK